MRSVVRRRTGLAVAVVLALAGCTTGPTRGDRLGVEEVEALRRSIALAGGAPPGASSPAANSPQTQNGGQRSPGASPRAQPPADGAKPEGLPPSRAELERRAHAAIGPGRAVEELTFVGEVPRYAFALEQLPSAKEERLLLIDLSADPGLVVGEHDFGPADAADAEGQGEPAAMPIADAPAVPTRIARALEVTSDSGEPVLLAEIGGASTSAACGWWLRRRGTTFVCAPRVVASSSYRSMGRVLVETWQIALPGTEGEEGLSGASGRLFRILGGRWRQEDEYHCMAWSLEAALREAGPPGLAAWQTAAVRQRVVAARRASDALETDQAIALLRDALAIDGCDPTAWRVLGRLEFERGRAASAAPALAVALALAGGEPATMVDLADAVAVLNPSPGAGAASLHASVEALESHGVTRTVVDQARQEAGGHVTPRGLAIALYESFLARTSPEDPRLEAARRRAAEQVSALRQSGQTPTRARPPAKAAPKAKSKRKTSPKAK